MKNNSFETTDIFRGAFLLCRGGELNGIRFRRNGKRIATFLITGEGLDKLDKQYRDGQALVNPLQFRETLNHLRDILFEKLRDNHAKEAAGLRTRKDRKRKEDKSCPVYRMKRYSG